jgi:hypothetical protein
VPTTSHPPRRSRGKDADTSHPIPIKGVRLRVEVSGAGGAELKRLAAEKGMAARDEGGKVSLTIAAKTPEEALAQLALLKAILSSKS